MHLFGTFLNLYLLFQWVLLLRLCVSETTTILFLSIYCLISECMVFVHPFRKIAYLIFPWYCTPAIKIIFIMMLFDPFIQPFFCLLEHISKKFKKKTILNDISYTFETGKIYGIYGINGSGKTMLLRIISGLVFPTSGSIIINGKTLHKEISFPDHMGLIIENMELQPQLTAFENLEELNKINHYATTSDIQDALRKINLQSNEKVKKFSLGMKQKLNIAQAIFENPRLLLLDEPTNALDSDAIEHLKAILEDLKKKNCCIIIATHDHQNITSLCDQILEMKEGNLYDKN